MVTGLVFVLLALFCDGVYGPYQNKIKTKAKANGFKITGDHNMFNLNFWQGIFALCFCLAYGEIGQVMDFIQRNPSVTVDLLKFGAAMAMGNIFIFEFALRRCRSGDRDLPVNLSMRLQR